MSGTGGIGGWVHWFGVLVALSLAILAAWSLVGSPSDRIGRARAGARAAPVPRAGSPAESQSRRRDRWKAWLHPRPDAIARPARALLAAGLGCSVVVLGVLTRPAPGSGVVGAGMLGSGLLAAGIGYLVSGRVESPAARRRRHRMVIELPHVLDLLAACLRAGLPLRSAVREVLAVTDGPLADDLGLVIRQIDLGVAEAEAWRSLRTHPVLGRLAVDLARSVESGTMIVQTLRQHARDARRARRGALEVRAKTVGVHSVPPLMVCFLPAFLLIGVVPTGVSAFLHALR